MVARIAPAVGLLGGVILAVLTPWASSLFSRGEIVVEFALSIPFGLIFASVVVAQIIGLACLIPLGKGAALAKSTAVGTALNVPLMFAMGTIFGAPGVAWAVGIAEVVVAGYQILVVRDSLRHLGHPPVPAPLRSVPPKR
jgi:O-antigen/teichoic acid export membrane protein